MSHVYVEKSAVFSPCRRYRYRLDRVWDPTLPRFATCMLNPSKANAEDDDNTITRVTGFGKLWGFGGYTVVNLGAWCETHPNLLRGVIDWIGPDNDQHILEVAKSSQMFLAGWGALGGPKWLRTRADKVLWTLQAHVNVMAFQITKYGMPQHPLMLPAKVTPTIYKACRSAA